MKQMLRSKLLYEKGLIKNLKMLTQSQFSQIKFIAKIGNVKKFFGSLKAINFEEDATFIISENGLRVVVESSKLTQASVYISKEYFTEFHIPENEIICFNINLNIVTDCLSIFSDLESTLKIIYKGYGAPLVLVLTHHGEDHIISECSIKTKTYTEPIDYNIDETNENFNNIIIRGPDLSDILSEIDKSADGLEIIMSNESPYFKITEIGVSQSESNIEIAKTSDMILLFSCKSKTVAQYKMSHIKLIMKSLLLASKVSIRTDSNGLLCLQFMITCNDDDAEVQIHIEFFIIPLVSYE